MNGLVLIVVSLWFLPVVFFVIIPLSVACLGLVVSFVGSLKPVAGKRRSSINIKAVSAT